MTRVMDTPYLAWAKQHQAATFNLATSGAPHVSFAEIGGVPADMPLAGANSYGYPPLLSAIASHCGVQADQVVTSTGCSMANFLALATLLAPGDEVLIERPTYEPLLRAALHLGATVRRFDREPADGCRLEARRVIDALTPRTKAIVIVNLHNPTSQLVGDDVLREIGEAAMRIGARVLVDEVYLDAVFDATPPSSVHLGRAFIATSSLTKVYGLSALRCGWLVADGEFAERAWRVADLYGNVQPFVPEWLATRAFERLPALRTRTHTLLETNRASFRAWAGTRDDLLAIPATYGTTVCAHPTRVDVPTFCHRLRSHYDVSVVPGHFFELPDFFRIGLTADAPSFAEGLARIATCLDEFTRGVDDA